MLMRDQHLYKSLAIKVCDRHCRLRLPWLIFFQCLVEKLQAWLRIEPPILDLRSQLGAFDHSAMAIPMRD